MNALMNNPVFRFVQENSGLLFPAAAAAAIFVILIPLPTVALDFLLIINILLTTVVLMTVMYIRTPLEFSSFPSLLLALTLLRLVLNTATTRLILSNGASGADAAGQVIEAFGAFVASNSLAVGVIIFAIITIIQFVVITKGATRIAEVAARFTLDGMPGKQMAIDADLNAGAIDEREARRRRDEVSREADFFGAMDGASKFVRGDAIAGIIITAVNIVGGIYVGMVEGQLSLMQSLETFTMLSIGDGLASQVPAFIVSIGAGMLVTRSTGQTNMGEDVIRQLIAKPIALGLAAGFLGVLTLTPLPKLPLVTMAAGCGMMAYFVNQSQNAQAARIIADERTKERTKPVPIESHLAIDALELQVGFGLVRLVDRARGGDMLDRVGAMRKQMALDMGVLVPPVRIRDASELQPNQYAILLRGQEIARGEALADQLLAIDSGAAAGTPLPGIETLEPAFGLRAWWIAPDERTRAEQLSYTVVEPTGVLATHLTEVIKRYADSLLSRSDTQKLLDNLKVRNNALVEEVVPGLLKTGEVQKVLQGLLRERVPIRDLEAVLEALGDWAPKSKDVDVLIEYARNALARTICAQYRDSEGKLHCITFDPKTEDYIEGNIRRLEHGSAMTIPPDRQAAIAASVKQQVEQSSGKAAGSTVALLCSPTIRSWVRRIIEPVLPHTPVLGMNEVVRGVDIRAHGVVSLDV